MNYHKKNSDNVIKILRDLQILVTGKSQNQFTGAIKAIVPSSYDKSGNIKKYIHFDVDNKKLDDFYKKRLSASQSPLVELIKEGLKSANSKKIESTEHNIANIGSGTIGHTFTLEKNELIYERVENIISRRKIPIRYQVSDIQQVNNNEFKLFLTKHNKNNSHNKTTLNDDNKIEEIIKSNDLVSKIKNLIGKSNNKTSNNKNFAQSFSNFKDIGENLQTNVDIDEINKEYFAALKTIIEDCKIRIPKDKVLEFYNGNKTGVNTNLQVRINNHDVGVAQSFAEIKSNIEKKLGELKGLGFTNHIKGIKAALAAKEKFFTDFKKEVKKSLGKKGQDLIKEHLKELKPCYTSPPSGWSRMGISKEDLDGCELQKLYVKVGENFYTVQGYINHFLNNQNSDNAFDDFDNPQTLPKSFQ